MRKFLLGFFSFGWLRGLDFLPPLLLRLFLAPLLFVSGQQKLGLFTSSDVAWYNPMTWVNSATYQTAADAMSNVPVLGSASGVTTGLIGSLEIIGAFLLLIGLAVRWISLPLLALVALTGLVALNGQDIVATLKETLMTHGYTDMSSSGFAKSLMYFLMLLTLFFMGAGRFFSVDWFLYHGMNKKVATGTSHAKHDQEDPFDLDNTTDDDHL